MKKTLFFGLMAAALGFTACSSEDDAIIADKPQKGMVLKASVNQPSETRAAITQTTATWTFAFAADDEVSVKAQTVENYYTFTKDATSFKSADATPTESATKWYAYYPQAVVGLTGQTGELTGEGNSVANLYAMAGVTAEDVTGEEALSITMQPQVAILKIDNQKGNIDIRARTSDKYVTGLTAKSGEAGFDLQTTPTATSLFSATTSGTYYVVVPAGVYLTIMDGNDVENSTTAGVTEGATPGFTAGKYYELKIENAVRPTYESSSPAANNSTSAEGPAKLVDSDGTATKWCDWNDNGKWEMIVSIPSANKLKAIKLWNTNDTEWYPKRTWKSLKVSGSASADGTWAEIYNETNLGLSINNYGLAGELMVNATTAYQYYKLEVAVEPYTGSAYWDHNNTMQMADMKFVLE